MVIDSAELQHSVVTWLRPFQVVRLLAFISDKDMFAEFYRKKLSRRLLHDKSSSDDHERSILSRLKQQCGAQFTSKVPARHDDLSCVRLQVMRHSSSALQVHAGGGACVRACMCSCSSGWLCAACTQMEGMINDLQVAREKQTAFTDWVKAQGKTLPVDMTVTVRPRGREGMQ
jgi:hypothetical protein